MARNILTNINLNKNQIQNMVLQPLATDPAVASSVQGQLYFNTNTNRVRQFTGAIWCDVGGGVQSIQTVTGETVIYVDNTDPENPILEFKISATQGDGVAITKETDGVKVNVQDGTTSQKGIVQLDSTPSSTEETKAATPKGANVTLEALATPTADYLKTYEIKQGGVSVGKIDIPMDFVIKDAQVKTCTTDDDPIAGLKVGDLYIDIEINVKSGTVTSTHLYIDCKKLGKFPYKTSATIAAGGLSTTIALPAKSTYLNAYVLDDSGEEVVCDIKVTDATTAAAGSVAFTIASAYTAALTCYAVYMA